jgi:hypothetical protein
MLLLCLLLAQDAILCHSTVLLQPLAVLLAQAHWLRHPPRLGTAVWQPAAAAAGLDSAGVVVQQQGPAAAAAAAAAELLDQPALGCSRCPLLSFHLLQPT